MRIDVHAHYWTEGYIDLLVDLGQAGAVMARGLGAGGGAELEARLRLMGREGIEMQLLSACPQLPYGEDAKKAAREASRSTGRRTARCLPAPEHGRWSLNVRPGTARCRVRSGRSRSRPCGSWRRWRSCPRGTAGRSPSRRRP